MRTALSVTEALVALSLLTSSCGEDASTTDIGGRAESETTDPGVETTETTTAGANTGIVVEATDAANALLASLWMVRSTPCPTTTVIQPS